MAQSAAGQSHPLHWEKPAGAVIPPKHNNRLPFLIGGIIIVAAVIFLVVTGMIAGGRFFITVDEVVNNPEYAGQSVRVAGAVIGESIVYDAENLTIEFTVVNIAEPYDDLAEALHQAVNDPTATRMHVRVENMVKPELLQDEAQAIMTGRLENGVFYANELNLKCPTRFTEAGPEHEMMTSDGVMPADHPVLSEGAGS